MLFSSCVALCELQTRVQRINPQQLQQNPPHTYQSSKIAKATNQQYKKKQKTEDDDDDQQLNTLLVHSSKANWFSTICEAYDFSV